MRRLHPREQSTAVATSALATAMYGELEKHDLTGAEWLRVVHGAYDSVLGGFIKLQIRDERHGNVDTPGGLAEDQSSDSAPGPDPDEYRVLLSDRPTIADVDPSIIGAIRRGPQGHGVVRIDNAGEEDWLMVGGARGRDRGDVSRSRYTDGEVADWPVIGAVPGTPAAWLAGEPVPTDDAGQ